MADFLEQNATAVDAQGIEDLNANLDWGGREENQESL